ncbi:GrpB family protein [Liberiplasma polymorphum]|uniref:GrpB family protein n=1 Tax=Liberiplasma polymorphum TaxID=3374570 RepID=UPI0037746B8A
MIGLKNGVVKLESHNSAWINEANHMIQLLSNIFQENALDIQHIGSTSIPLIKAKPIIDLALKVDDFSSVKNYISDLEALGFIYNRHANLPNAMYFNRKINNKTVSTHHLHVFHNESQEWRNHIYFRDYLNQNAEVAKAYEQLKEKLLIAFEHNRPMYTELKADFIKQTIRKAQVYNFLGKVVKIKIDRPIGAIHPKHPEIIYPINYGYIENEIAPDEEALDVYLLGVDEKVSSYEGKIIAIIHRKNDIEDKLVMAPIGVTFTAKEIQLQTYFQEQFYISKIETK